MSTDDDGAEKPTDDLPGTVPEHTTTVQVPVPVPRAVEREARQRADELDADLRDCLRDHVTVDPDYLLGGEANPTADRMDAIYVRVSPELLAKLSTISNGAVEEWVRGAIKRSLSDVAELMGGQNTGGSFAGPAGVPEGLPESEAGDET